MKCTDPTKFNMLDNYISVLHPQDCILYWWIESRGTARCSLAVIIVIAYAIDIVYNLIGHIIIADYLQSATYYIYGTTIVSIIGTDSMLISNWII